MTDAKRDQNNVPTLLGTLSTDGVTPTPVYANSSTNLLDIADGVTSDGIVSRFKLNETSGNTAIDYAETMDGTIKANFIAYYPYNGNANDESRAAASNGTVVGATLATGRLGDANSAYQFTANGQWISSTVTVANVRSISIWVNCSDNTTAGTAVYGSNSADFQWYKQATNSWIITFSYSGTRYYFQYDFKPVSDSAWHHYVFSFHQTVLKLSVYKDSVLQWFNSSTGSVASGGNTTFKVGSADTEGNVYLRGSVDEVVLMPYTLTQDNVTDLYQMNRIHDLNKPFVTSGGKSYYELWGSDSASTNSAGVVVDCGVGISNAIQSQSQFTIAYWVKQQSYSASAFAIGWYGGNYLGPQISTGSNGNIDIQIGQGNTTGSLTNKNASVSGVYIIGSWNHLVMLYDGIYIKVYANNKLVYTYNIGAFVDNGLGSQTFKIGCNPWDYNRLGSGSIRDLNVYNYALSEEQIANLFNEVSVSEYLDENHVPVLKAVSSEDGITPVALHVNALNQLLIKST